jgi:hypothetical protein
MKPWFLGEFLVGVRRQLIKKCVFPYQFLLQKIRPFSPASSLASFQSANWASDLVPIMPVIGTNSPRPAGKKSSWNFAEMR